MKFTPGPHEIVTLNGRIDDWTGASFVILDRRNAPGGVAVIMGGLGVEEETANARLFAAAPEMYQMLVEMKERVYNPFEPDNQSAVYGRLCAVLARVEGAA